MKPAAAIASAAIAATLIAAMPAVSRAASAEDLIRQAADRAEISELMWKYARYGDTFNAQAYAGLFTADGAFGNVKGHDALVKMEEGFAKGRADRAAKGEKQGTLYHMETNEHIEFVSRDHARVHYYWLTVLGPPEGAAVSPANLPPVRVLAVGQGLDDVVRVDGQWKIQLRNVVAKDVP